MSKRTFITAFLILIQIFAFYAQIYSIQNQITSHPTTSPSEILTTDPSNITQTQLFGNSTNNTNINLVNGSSNSDISPSAKLSSTSTTSTQAQSFTGPSVTVNAIRKSVVASLDDFATMYSDQATPGTPYVSSSDSVTNPLYAQDSDFYMFYYTFDTAVSSANVYLNIKMHIGNSNGNIYQNFVGTMNGLDYYTSETSNKFDLSSNPQFIDSAGYVNILVKSSLFYDVVAKTGFYNLSIFIISDSGATKSIETQSTTIGADASSISVQADRLVFVPNNTTYNDRLDSIYKGNGQYQHTLSINNFDYNTNYTVSAPLDMELININPQANAEIRGNDYNIYNTVPTTYTLTFAEGPGFGRNIKSTASILPLIDKTSNIFNCPSFETCWINDWTNNPSLNPFETVSLSNTYAYDQLASLYLANTGGTGTLSLTVPNGEYYFSYKVYLQSYSGSGAIGFYSWDGSSSSWQSSLLNTSNTDRWQTVTSNFNIYNTDPFLSANLKFVVANGVTAKLYLDDLHIYQISTTTKTIQNNQLQIMSQLNWWTNYELEPAIRKNTSLTITDRTSQSLLFHTYVTSDDNGILTYVYKQYLSPQEYSVYLNALDNTWSGTYTQTYPGYYDYFKDVLGTPMTFESTVEGWYGTNGASIEQYAGMLQINTNEADAGAVYDLPETISSDVFTNISFDASCVYPTTLYVFRDNLDPDGKQAGNYVYDFTCTDSIMHYNLPLSYFVPSGLASNETVDFNSIWFFSSSGNQNTFFVDNIKLLGHKDYASTTTGSAWDWETSREFFYNELGLSENFNDSTTMSWMSYNSYGLVQNTAQGNQTEYFQNVLDTPMDFNYGSTEGWQPSSGSSVSVFNNMLNITTTNTYSGAYYTFPSYISIYQYTNISFDLSCATPGQSFGIYYSHSDSIKEYGRKLYTFVCSTTTPVHYNIPFSAFGLASAVTLQTETTSFNSIWFWAVGTYPGTPMIFYVDNVKILGTNDYASFDSSNLQTWDWQNSHEYFYNQLGVNDNFNDGSTNSWQAGTTSDLVTNTAQGNQTEYFTNVLDTPMTFDYDTQNWYALSTSIVSQSNGELQADIGAEWAGMQFLAPNFIGKDVYTNISFDMHCSGLTTVRVILEYVEYGITYGRYVQYVTCSPTKTHYNLAISSFSYVFSYYLKPSSFNLIKFDSDTGSSGTIFLDNVKLLGVNDYATYDPSIQQSWAWQNSLEYFYDQTGVNENFADGSTMSWSSGSGYDLVTNTAQGNVTEYFTNYMNNPLDFNDGTSEGLTAENYNVANGIATVNVRGADYADFAPLAQNGIDVMQWNTIQFYVWSNQSLSSFGLNSQAMDGAACMNRASSYTIPASTWTLVTFDLSSYYTTLSCNQANTGVTGTYQQEQKNFDVWFHSGSTDLQIKMDYIKIFAGNDYSIYDPYIGKSWDWSTSNEFYYDNGVNENFADGTTMGWGVSTPNTALTGGTTLGTGSLSNGGVSSSSALTSVSGTTIYKTNTYSATVTVTRNIGSVSGSISWGTKPSSMTTNAIYSGSGAITPSAGTWAKVSISVQFCGSFSSTTSNIYLMADLGSGYIHVATASFGMTTSTKTLSASDIVSDAAGDSISFQIKNPSTDTFYPSCDASVTSHSYTNDDPDTSAVVQLQRSVDGSNWYSVDSLTVAGGGTWSAHAFYDTASFTTSINSLAYRLQLLNAPTFGVTTSSASFSQATYQTVYPTPSVSNYNSQYLQVTASDFFILTQTLPSNYVTLTASIYNNFVMEFESNTAVSSINIYGSSTAQGCSLSTFAADTWSLFNCLSTWTGAQTTIHIAVTLSSTSSATFYMNLLYIYDSSLGGTQGFTASPSIYSYVDPQGYYTSLFDPSYGWTNVFTPSSLSIDTATYRYLTVKFRLIGSASISSINIRGYDSSQTNNLIIQFYGSVSSTDGWITKTIDLSGSSLWTGYYTQLWLNVNHASVSDNSQIQIDYMYLTASNQNSPSGQPMLSAYDIGNYVAVTTTGQNIDANTFYSALVEFYPLDDVDNGITIYDNSGNPLCSTTTTYSANTWASFSCVFNTNWVGTEPGFTVEFNYLNSLAHTVLIQRIYLYDSPNGNTQGWTADPLRYYYVDPEGYLVSTNIDASHYPTIYSPSLSVDTSVYKYMTVRIKSNSPAGSSVKVALVDSSGSVLEYAILGTLSASDTFQIFTFDLSTLTSWDSSFDHFYIQVLGYGATEWIDYVHLTADNQASPSGQSMLSAYDIGNYVAIANFDQSINANIYYNLFVEFYPKQDVSGIDIYDDFNHLMCSTSTVYSANTWVSFTCVLPYNPWNSTYGDNGYYQPGFMVVFNYATSSPHTVFIQRIFLYDDIESDWQGWYSNTGYTYIDPAGFLTTTVSATSGGYVNDLTSPGLSIDTSIYKYLTVKLRIIGSSTDGIYLHGINSTSANNNIVFVGQIYASSDWVTLTLDLSQDPLWTGTYSQIWLNSNYATPSSGFFTIQIDYILLTAGNTTSPSGKPMLSAYDIGNAVGLTTYDYIDADSYFHPFIEFYSHSNITGIDVYDNVYGTPLCSTGVVDYGNNSWHGYSCDMPYYLWNSTNSTGGFHNPAYYEPGFTFIFYFADNGPHTVFIQRIYLYDSYDPTQGWNSTVYEDDSSYNYQYVNPQGYLVSTVTKYGYSHNYVTIPILDVDPNVYTTLTFRAKASSSFISAVKLGGFYGYVLGSESYTTSWQTFTIDLASDSHWTLSYIAAQHYLTFNIANGTDVNGLANGTQLYLDYILLTAPNPIANNTHYDMLHGQWWGVTHEKLISSSCYYESTCFQLTEGNGNSFYPQLNFGSMDLSTTDGIRFKAIANVSMTLNTLFLVTDANDYFYYTGDWQLSSKWDDIYISSFETVGIPDMTHISYMLFYYTQGQSSITFSDFHFVTSFKYQFTPISSADTDYYAYVTNKTLDFSKNSGGVSFAGGSFAHSVQNGYLQVETNARWINILLPSPIDTSETDYYNNFIVRFYINQSFDMAMYLASGYTNTAMVTASNTWQFYTKNILDGGASGFYFANPSQTGTLIRIDFIRLVHRDTGIISGFGQDFNMISSQDLESNYNGNYFGYSLVNGSSNGHISNGYFSLNITQADSGFVYAPSSTKTADPILNTYDYICIDAKVSNTAIPFSLIKADGSNVIINNIHFTSSFSEQCFAFSDFAWNYAYHDYFGLVQMGSSNLQGMLTVDYIHFVNIDTSNIVLKSDNYVILSDTEKTYNYNVWLDGASLGVYFSTQQILINSTYGDHIIRYQAFAPISNYGVFVPSVIYEFNYSIIQSGTEKVVFRDQQGVYISPNTFNVFVNGIRTVGGIFPINDVLKRFNLTVTDAWNYTIYTNPNEPYTTIKDFSVTLYSLKIQNMQDNPIWVDFVRGTTGASFSSWVFPYEVQEFKVLPATYTTTIWYSNVTSDFAVTKNGYKLSYSYPVTQDTAIRVTGTSIQDVFNNVFSLSQNLDSYNKSIIQALNSTIGNQTLAINSSLQSQTNNITLSFSNTNDIIGQQTNLINIILGNTNSTIKDQLNEIYGEINNFNSTIDTQTNKLWLIINDTRDNITLQYNTLNGKIDTLKTNLTLQFNHQSETITNIDTNVATQIASIVTSFNSQDSTIYNQTMKILLSFNYTNTALYQQTVQILDSFNYTNTTLYQQTVHILDTFNYTNTTLYQQTVHILSAFDFTNTTLYQQTLHILNAFNSTDTALFGQTVQILNTFNMTNTTLYQQTVGILTKFTDMNSTIQDQTANITNSFNNLNSNIYSQVLDILGKIDNTNSTIQSQVLNVLTRLSNMNSSIASQQGNISQALTNISLALDSVGSTRSFSIVLVSPVGLIYNPYPVLVYVDYSYYTFTQTVNKSTELYLSSQTLKLPDNTLVTVTLKSGFGDQLYNSTFYLTADLHYTIQLNITILTISNTASTVREVELWRNNILGYNVTINPGESVTLQLLPTKYVIRVFEVFDKPIVNQYNQTLSRKLLDFTTLTLKSAGTKLTLTPSANGGVNADQVKAWFQDMNPVTLMTLIVSGAVGTVVATVATVFVRRLILQKIKEKEHHVRVWKDNK